MEEGWIWYWNVGYKAHYYTGGKSLCGRWDLKADCRDRRQVIGPIPLEHCCKMCLDLRTGRNKRVKEKTEE